MEKAYFRLRGQGPPLIFIHGALGHKRNFQSIARAFESDYTTLVYDQRCHGLSPYFSPPHHLKQLAKDLKDLSERFFPKEKLRLIGHSLGGWTALIFADLWPERVGKIIAADSPPRPLPERLKKIERIIRSLPDGFSQRESAKLFFEKKIQDKSLSKKMAEFLYGGLLRRKSHISLGFDKKGVMEMAKSARSYNFFRLIQNLKTPALFLRGGHSKDFLKQDFQKLKDLNEKHVQAVEIAGAGHWLHQEQKAVFIEKARGFLKDII